MYMTFSRKMAQNRDRCAQNRSTLVTAPSWSWAATDRMQHLDMTRNDVIRSRVPSAVSMLRIRSLVLRTSSIWRSTCSRISDTRGNTIEVDDWRTSFCGDESKKTIGVETRKRKLIEWLTSLEECGVLLMPATTDSHGLPVSMQANNGYRSRLMPRLRQCWRIPTRSTLSMLSHNFEYSYRKLSVNV